MAASPRGPSPRRGSSTIPSAVNREIDLGKAIRKALKRTVHMMLYAPVPFIGVKGIHYMARKIERLPARGDVRYARLLLAHIVRMQEEIGTGGGGFRFMYAAFLQEAGELLGSAPLGEASQMMTEAGNLWRQFALASARACKNKTADPDLGEIVQRLRVLRRPGEAGLYDPQIMEPLISRASSAPNASTLIIGFLDCLLQEEKT